MKSGLIDRFFIEFTGLGENDRNKALAAYKHFDPSGDNKNGWESNFLPYGIVLRKCYVSNLYK